MVNLLAVTAAIRRLWLGCEESAAQKCARRVGKVIFHHSETFGLCSKVMGRKSR